MPDNRIYYSGLLYTKMVAIIQYGNLYTTFIFANDDAIISIYFENKEVLKATLEKLLEQLKV